MPVYEYRCKSCDTAFEHLARTMSATEDIRCPSCDSHDVEKALSVFAAREGARRPAPGPQTGYPPRGPARVYTSRWAPSATGTTPND